MLLRMSYGSPGIYTFHRTARLLDGFYWLIWVVGLFVTAMGGLTYKF